jgi:predicted nucleic acid-binding protein
VKSYLADATLVIALHREQGHGPVTDWLATLPDARLTQCVITEGEFLEGNRDLVWLRSAFGRPIPVNEQTASVMAEIQRRRARNGKRLGENDAWMAALAVQHDLHLLTADDTFGGIPRLRFSTFPKR